MYNAEILWGEVMKQEVKIDDQTVILDSEITYSGLANPDDDEKLVRKAIGLPITKQILYYKDKRNSDAVRVINYRIVEMYQITDRWYTLELTTEENTITQIHSAYLAEMQKANFIADMAKQMAQ